MKQSYRKIIRSQILNYLKNREGKQFQGLRMTEHIKFKMNKPLMYTDTILRELRQLREDGKIIYSTVGNKKDSTYLLEKFN